MKMNNQFWSLEHDCRCDKEELFYWDKTKKWITRREYIDNGGSWFHSGFPCKSYKAAIRYL